MYNIPYFKAADDKQVIDFMHAHPFAILTGVDAEQMPVATHVPLLVKQEKDILLLQGHIMRNTDHHQAFVGNGNVLAIFTGPHAYVSASWYTDKKQASTWNYLTVHAHGKLKFGDEDMLLAVLKETTAHFENNPGSPSLVEHLDVDYVGRLMKAIVAFEIQVTRIEHVFKLSQNRDEESYQSIINHLEEGDEEAKMMAAIMQKSK